MKTIQLSLTILFSCITSHILAQFPEGFETTVPPSGWVTFIGSNGLGTVQNWQASNISNTGTQSAYVRYENVSGGLAQDWLVTPQFTPTSATNILTFMQRQSYTTDYGSVYKVFVS
ncbi:MAG: choice-of-anchor J domain-containing protein, partial [Crocinitomicaceae bacterium]|nr:choice-of-anchor J domain-containing protein [Crocinitomicaceae bacterium]